MKTYFKQLFAFFTIMFTILLAYFGVLLEPKYYKKTVFVPCNNNNNIKIRYNDNKILSNNEYIKFDDIPTTLINTFLATEDQKFFSHNGIDYSRILKSAIVNLKSRSYKQGGSTITQQLIKNTQLSNEKTMPRKIKEIRLAKEIERNLDKKTIFEYYANSLYFLPNVYGVANACRILFNEDIKNITLAQSAVLVAIINNPSLYSPYNNYEKCMKKKEKILKNMYKQNYISKEQLDAALKENILIHKNTTNKNYDLTKEVNFFFDNLNINKEDKIEIISTLDQNLCKVLEEKINEVRKNDLYYKAVLIDNKTGEILAIYNKNNVNKRQVGSVIKPILCYCPAIEYNHVNICTPILDKELNFSSFSPKNFMNSYEGYIPVSQALKKSSNVCAVRLLDYVGIDNAIKFANKHGLSFEKQDKTYSIALGSSDFDLIEITNSYIPFANYGNFIKAHLIKKIIINGNIYNNKHTMQKTMKKSTAALMNIMLIDCAKTGTAKRLNSLPLSIAAKTGTVGTKEGNTDAYCIAYTKKYTLGVWVGTADYKIKNKNIAGSNISTQIAYSVFDYLYTNQENPQRLDTNSDITSARINSREYNENQRLILDDKSKPKDTKLVYLAKEKIKYLKHL